MTQLKELQKEFSDALLATSFSDEHCLLKRIRGGGNVSAFEQVRIYRQLVRTNHHDVLADSYPAVRKVVGKDYFAQAAAGYFKGYPPSRSDLNGYGEFFSNYLSELCQERKELKHLAYLGDLAQVEWEWGALNRKGEVVSKDFQVLQSLSEDAQGRLCFQLNPSLVLLRFRFRIHLMWDFILNSAEHGKGFDIEEKETFLCMWKVGEERYAREVGAIEAEFFDFFGKAKENEALEESFYAFSEMQRSRLAEFVATSIQLGWFTGFSLIDSGECGN